MMHSTPLRWSSIGLTLTERVVLAICWISMTLKHHSDVRARVFIKGGFKPGVALDYVAYDGRSVQKNCGVGLST